VRHYPPRPTPHPGRHWTPTRDRAAQRRFRTRVLANAGHQCQYIDPTWGRCAATTDLHAHHTQPNNQDPNTGLALCRTHHRLIDKHAR
jgi:predicted restriction endonuclease